MTEGYSATVMRSGIAPLPDIYGFLSVRSKVAISFSGYCPLWDRERSVLYNTFPVLSRTRRDTDPYITYICLLDPYLRSPRPFAATHFFLSRDRNCPTLDFPLCPIAIFRNISPLHFFDAIERSISRAFIYCLFSWKENKYVLEEYNESVPMGGRTP